jgi:hypothetical protein
VSVGTALAAVLSSAPDVGVCVGVAVLDAVEVGGKVGVDPLVD